MPKRCHGCGTIWAEKRSPGFREECLACGAPLHACVNCRFYDPNAAEWCREPQARSTKPRDPAAASTCEYFLFGESADREAEADRARKAREGLAALFGEAPPEDPDAGAAPDWQKAGEPTKPFDPFRPA